MFNITQKMPESKIINECHPHKIIKTSREKVRQENSMAIYYLLE